MQGMALQSGWETFLLAAPVVGMILVAVFRLDVIAANASRTYPRAPGNDENGHPLLTDPDGRTWTDSGDATPSAN